MCTSEDLTEVLLSKLLKHKYVQAYWSTITTHTDNTILIWKILQTLVYVPTLSKSVKLYSRSSITQKSEPALLKTLQQSRKWQLFHMTSNSFLKSTLQGFTFVEIFTKFSKVFFRNLIFLTSEIVFWDSKICYVSDFSQVLLKCHYCRNNFHLILLLHKRVFKTNISLTKLVQCLNWYMIMKM